MTSFLEGLHTAIEGRGQQLAEVMAPDVVSIVQGSIDEWFEDHTTIDRELWDSKLRSALIYKTLKHLAWELDKTTSMHRDVVFSTLQREHEEAA